MNSTAQYEFTILVPVYNEDDRLQKFFMALDSYKENTKRHFCVLFVNDDSTDKSLSMIRDYCMRMRDCFYISLMQRTGLSGTIKAGISRVHSEYVGYIDPGLQTRPVDFELLFQKAHDSAMVCGERDFSSVPFYSHLWVRVCALARRLVTGDAMSAVSFPLRLGRTEVLKQLPWFSGIHSYVPALVKMSGNRVTTVRVNFNRRARPGRVRRQMFGGTAAGVCNLFVFMWMRRRFLDPAVSDSNLQGR